MSQQNNNEEKTPLQQATEDMLTALNITQAEAKAQGKTEADVRADFWGAVGNAENAWENLGNEESNG